MDITDPDKIWLLQHVCMLCYPSIEYNSIEMYSCLSRKYMTQRLFTEFNYMVIMINYSQRI